MLVKMSLPNIFLLRRENCEVETIKIKNCNNIVDADIRILPGALNIKFGFNGTGKSTISQSD